MYQARPASGVATSFVLQYLTLGTKVISRGAGRKRRRPAPTTTTTATTTDVGVVRIMPAEFFSVRDAAGSYGGGGNNAVVSRITKILDAYACFHAPDDAQPASSVPPSNHHHHHHHHPQHSVNNAHHHPRASLTPYAGRRSAHSVPNATHSIRRFKDDGHWGAGATTSKQRPGTEWSCKNPALRAIMGALNKISDKNYAAIRDKIVGVLGVGSASASDVCAALLSKCYQEDCYLPLYSKIFRDIRDVSPSVCDTVCDTLVQFVDKVIQDTSLSVVTIDSTPSYDEFCNVSKRKRHAIGKNRAVLAFMRQSFVASPTPGMYFGFLTGLLGAPGIDVELVLDFIADFVRTFPTPEVGTRPWIDMLQTVYEEHVEPTCSPRCKFKMMDIHAMCKDESGKKGPVSFGALPRIIKMVAVV